MEYDFIHEGQRCRLIPICILIYLLVDVLEMARVPGHQEDPPRGPGHGPEEDPGLRPGGTGAEELGLRPQVVRRLPHQGEHGSAVQDSPAGNPRQGRGEQYRLLLQGKNTKFFIIINLFKII